ncbi:hypothetical protein BDU57DRAFT_522382 [Ampelomyces quisqualis]|uniref:C3H1-type domain-containing protein n=1 Tax=Ampelomyces quisqualis TaxID=50730 RepID=A0A6A5Q9C5_AMPQU|nr:hypothetical protein BDU57DRAFT_522382 [Ampelomyces quisqualis]
MSSFKFPPPPPPPPKASSNNNQQPYPSQRGSNGRGRGDVGRGRGGNRGGAGNFGGNPRGGVRNERGGHSRGGLQNNRGGQSQRGSSGPAPGQWQQRTPFPQATMSSGSLSAYVDPSFAPPPPIDPSALVQAMSFMATPAGAQSMAAFASHMAGVEGPPPGLLPQLQQVEPPPQFPPTRQSGLKRKRDDRKSNAHTQSPSQSQHHPQQSSSKPTRAKAAVPPPVPTFGFTMPRPSPGSAPKANQTRDNRKGKVRLGLTVQDAAPEESSEEEDVDEEAALSAKLKGGGYAFEHEGEHISLQTKGDIADWIKDRRRNFPTYQKALEKAQAAATKRKNELQFVRKLKGEPPQEDDRPVREVAPVNYQRNKTDEKKQEELAALRKKLHESMVKKKETPAAIDLGLGYTSATESEGEESSVLSDSSVLSSSEESSDDSGDEAEDSDAPPEPTSSKIAPPPIKVPPSTMKERKPDKEKMCKSWRQYGKCPFGHNCRYKHVERAEKRTGLYEKLVEQELVKTDQLTLDAIKYLGQNGFLG